MSTVQALAGTETIAAVNLPSHRAFGLNDMYEAHCIQSSLLPTAPLNDEAFEIAFRYMPFAEVGGDFADFFRMPDGLVGIYVGDVVGKGLSAAMYGAMVMGAFRGIKKTGSDTARVLALLNERLMQRPVPARFCCTLYALFDPSTGDLTFSNAGLPLPLLMAGDTCRPLGDGGLPSGTFPDVTYDQHRVRLCPGSSVLFATDGLHECCNREGSEFCAAGMAEAWTQCRDRPAGESVEYMFDRLRAFSEGGSRHDDITVVVLSIPSEK